MEARIGGEAQLYYNMPSTDLRAVEWDPNDWKWDGDLFIATPLNRNSSDYHSRQLFPLENGITMTMASSNSSSSCSDELNHKIPKENRDLEKKRRVSVVDDSSLTEEAAGTLTLKLGGRGYSIGDCYGTAGKKTKLGGAATPNRAICQVEDCGADLSKAKDYHRRHKVCEAHSKASRALVGNQMQRFCQQCSRFHTLQEFDEGKRSCRRRLAGHNKRRRKTQPDNVSNTSPVNDNQGSDYLLMSILKILSNMHSNRLNHTDDCDSDLLSHLLHSLSGQGSFHLKRNTSGRPLEFQNLLNNLTSMGNTELVSALLSNGSLGTQPTQQNCINPGEEMPRKDGELQATTSQSPGIVLSIQSNTQIDAGGRGTSAGRSKLNDFDLNDEYVDSDDGMDGTERLTVPLGLGTVSIECPSWVQQESHQSSPPQTSGNSDSASAQSPSSSSGDIQGRTDRIVFKLFGKEPGDFPIVLRAQIFDWLSNSPTDIESYIRPGCVILTIYLRLSESAWEELCCDLSSSLSRLLDFNDDMKFWNTGWIYMRVQNQMVFIYNGQVVVDTSLPCRIYDYSTILSVKPVAVASSAHARFVVKGVMISRPSTRLLCALEGNYLEADTKLVEPVDGFEGLDVQSLDIACFIPLVTGRGFIEVEDHGLSISFFPFIVAEDEVCREIRMLEKEIELTDIHNLRRGTGKFDARDQALEFLNEMGWLLHKFQSQSRVGQSDPNLSFFPFKRFKHLVEFSMDREWCAVVKKLLDILFNGTVRAGDQPLLRLALSDLGLLHRAVRKSSRSLVEMLLRYVPEKVADGLSLEYKSLVEIESFLFRPDVAGAGGLTPLHVAAGRDGSEDILEALTDDPGKVGIGAWKSAVDSTGFTPEDYARLRGHYSYTRLVQRKINKKVSSGHVVVCISDSFSDSSINQKLPSGVAAASMARFEIQQSCSICDQKLAYQSTGSSTLLYRPAMLSMVAIAAVCVCVALLFKSSPEVLYVFCPFRWEMLEYGSS